jgi:hypothetical protein
LESENYNEEIDEIIQELQRYQNYKPRLGFKDLLKRQLQSRIAAYQEMEKDYKGLHLIK